MTTRIPQPLVPILGQTIDDVDEQALEGLIGLQENSSLEVKSIMYKPEKKHELAKDVVAFANLAGGVLLIGAVEKSETITELRPIDTTGIELHIRNLLQRRVSPFLPGVGVAAIPSSEDDEGYVIVVVEPSPARPHAIQEGEDLRFPIKDGSSTRYLHMAEIRSALVESVRDGTARRELAAEIFDSARAQQDSQSEDDVWISMSAVPSLPGSLGISVASLNNLRHAHREGSYRLPYPDAWTHALATTGSGRFIIGDFDANMYSADWSSPRSVYADLYQDGATAITAKIPRAPDPEAQVSRVLHTSLLVQVLNLLLIAGQHMERTAAGGSLDVQIGLNSGLPIEVGTELSGAQPLHNSRYQRGASRASLTLMAEDLAVAGPSLVAAAFIAGSALMHEFGVPEVLGASRDGELLDTYTTKSWKQILGKWAAAAGVDYV